MRKNYLLSYFNKEVATRVAEAIQSRDPQNKYKVVEDSNLFFIVAIKKSTRKQRAAVEEVSQLLKVDFTGNPMRYEDCDSFLKEQLNNCELVYLILKSIMSQL